MAALRNDCMAGSPEPNRRSRLNWTSLLTRPRCRLVLSSLLGLWLFPGFVEAVVHVDCTKGQHVRPKLKADKVIVVKGTCTENLVIDVDDVTITTDGTTPAVLAALDPSQPTILLDGAHRVVIDGVIPNGITVSGGNFGIAATRGSTIDVANCHVTGASNSGIISSTNSTVAVDACSVMGNGNGIVAANTASAFVTNTTVGSNTASGIIATRSSYVRVGQDRGGTTVVKSVTVSGNAGTGIVIAEGSSGNVVGGTVEASGVNNIFVGRASSGQIGEGSNNLTGGVTIQNAVVGNGIAVEGGNATIVSSTIADNHLRGIVVSNGGSARIGVTNNNAVFGANTISGNGTDGIGIFHASSAFIGGNTIDLNVAFGINIGQATATLVGGNAITNNGQTGLFVRAGQALVGDSGFGVPTTVNTISGNGGAGPNTGGIFAFEGASIFVADAAISSNTGPALQAFEGGILEVRGSTAVTVPATGTTVGALVQFGSTLRVRDTASIISATSHGIQASNNTSVNITNNGAVQGNGAGAFGVQCFSSTLDGSAIAGSAATLTGITTNVSGTAGKTTGCNVFP